MKFSLFTLMAVVLLAAIFAAALAYQTFIWAMVAVNLAIVVLVFGTLGVWIGGFQRSFWIPFCFVGWLYLVLSFTDVAINRLGELLPTSHSAVDVWTQHNEDNDTSIMTVNEWVRGRVRQLPAEEPYQIIQAFASLLFATLAGVIASFLLRHKAATI